MFKKVVCCFLITFSVVLNTTGVFSQTKKSKVKPNPDLILADKYFDNFEYFAAAEKYSKVVKSSPENAYALFQLAECYRSYHNYKDAELYYQKVVSKYKSIYPLARYWYASTLRINGAYKKAIEQFEKFRAENLNANLAIELYREKAIQEIKGCNLTLDESKIKKMPINVVHLPEPINSKESDYSPVIINNDSSIALTSSRIGSVGKRKNKSMGGSTSDVYRFKKNELNTWDKYSKEKEKDGFKKLNSKYNECSGSFNGEGNKYYFTKCDEVIKKENYEEFNCAIYVSYKSEGKWGAPKRLNKNVNAPGQWNSQPSVSPDGTILFFVSKRPGGQGMHDIWYSTCNNDDNWGFPINLGDKINTLFSDVSPRYYSEDKVLFFSSNGHEGYGGLDIYMTNEEEGFETIYNAGTPFNTNRDDFYLVLGENKGYITSNREEGKGYDDVYGFDFSNKYQLLRTIENPNYDPRPPEKEVMEVAKIFTAKEFLITKIPHENLMDKKSFLITGSVTEENSTIPAMGGEVYIIDEFENSIQKVELDEYGSYSIGASPDNKDFKLVYRIVSDNEERFNCSNYNITYISNTHSSHTENANIAIIGETDFKDARSITLEGVILNESTKTPAEKATVLLADTSETILKSTQTDKSGYYKFSNLQSNRPYRVILQQSNSNSKNDTVKFLSEKLTVKASEAPVSRHLFDNIYFDFDSYTLRNEAKKVLDDLVEYCKSDSVIQVELYANTDSYGSPQYNKLLANRRGNEALNYILEKGIPSSSIVVNSIGDEHYIASNETKLGRQLNRRVEFYILGASYVASNTMTYIIEPNKTIYALAKEYDMSVEELKEINGLTKDELVSYTPIRVKRNKEVDDIIAPSTRLLVFGEPSSKNLKLEIELITKNENINKNFDYNNPEYLKYLDSAAVSEAVDIKTTQEIFNYIAKEGNTYTHIARLFGLDVELLKSDNNTTLDVITNIQKVKINVNHRLREFVGYVVKEGESVEVIANRFEISKEELVKINQLEGYTLAPQMIIKLQD